MILTIPLEFHVEDPGAPAFIFIPSLDNEITTLSITINYGICIVEIELSKYERKEKIST